MPDLAKMNAYIKFGEILPFGSQNIESKRNFDLNLRKMHCNNPKLDLAKMDAYIKFGEILPFGSQDIERKQNFGVNKGP